VTGHFQARQLFSRIFNHGRQSALGKKRVCGRQAPAEGRIGLGRVAQIAG
jgi:hypothetical protein